MTALIRMLHKPTALSALICGYDALMQLICIFGRHTLRQGGRHTMLERALKPLPSIAVSAAQSLGVSVRQSRRRLLSPVQLSPALLLLATFASTAAHAEAPTSYTLVIHLTPALCATHPELRRLRQCQEGFSLTVSQLQPEPPPQSEQGCAQEPARLSPLQARVVERIMPDEQLRDEAWRTSGSCTGMSANTYFRTITNYAGRLKVPPEFNADQAVVMRKEQLLRQLVDLNAGLKHNSLQLRCVKTPKFRQPMLTEIRVCYTPTGGYAECPAAVASNCPERFVVHGAP